MISQEMNLKEQIHHHLFSDIVNGVYTPGSILHEKNLMEKYGVSRAPIRAVRAYCATFPSAVMR